MFRRVMLLLLGLIVLTACSQQTVYDVPAGSILFQEDFSSEDNGWRIWNQDGSFVRYQAEGLHFFVNQANLDTWSTPGYTFKDMNIAVDAIKVDGPDNNAYGVICRFVDANNYYAFLISSDGYAGILRVVDGVYTLLNADSMQYAPSILQGEALNKISVACKGMNLAMMVNGETLFEVQDASFERGDVGLMVSSYDQAGVDILFDHLTVTQP